MFRLTLTAPDLAVLLLRPAVPLRADDGAKSYPAHVLIILHAEKPPADAPSPDYSAEGNDRAEALPQPRRRA